MASYAGPWNEVSGDFLLVVCGSTRHAPYLADWRKFKDHLRKVVKEQPGWAEVYSSPSPSSSQREDQVQMQGWCRLRDQEDADAAYRVFYGYRGILVHVWETCRSTDGHRLMRCNCSTRFSGVPEGHHSAGRCGIDIGRVNQLSGKTQAIPPMSYIPSPTTYAYPMYPPAQLYQQVSPYAVQAPQPQVYSTSTTGIPVNVHGGVVLTEARGIFIRNLSYNVTSNDLNQLLYTVGIPLKSQLLTDHKGAFKGSATALFKSKDEALYAIARLNGKEHMGMTIQVRMDTETTVVGRAEPMVVNGSYAY